MSNQMDETTKFTRAYHLANANRLSNLIDEAGKQFAEERALARTRADRLIKRFHFHYDWLKKNAPTIDVRHPKTWEW